MDKYKALNLLGEGTYGTVWEAVNRLTGEIVAIKKLKKKYYSWEECLSLREVQSLRKMKHPNVVKLKELIRENNLLYFVFEYMECNLYEVMKNRVTLFTEVEVRNWCFQVFQALAYVHQCGYFHRDLKPENLLVTENTIKIADFGLAREVKSQPPYTNYVSTRWYRAPEVLLQSPLYTSSVDMWAMGAILAELFTLKPLFPGSSEMDEIHKICSIIGSPNMSLWSEGLQLADSLNYQFPVFAPCRLSSLIPSASEDAVDLISSLCSWDPKSRPSAAEALRHSFFQPCFYIPPPLRQKADSSFIKFQTEMRSVPVRKMVAPEQTANRRFPEASVSNRASSCVPMAGMQSSSGIIPGILMDNMGVYTNKKAIASSRSKMAAYQHEAQYNSSGLGCAGARPAPKYTLDGPLYSDRRLVYPPSGCAPVNAGRSDVVDTKGRSRVASQSTWYRPPPILRPNHVHGIYEAAC